MRVFLFLLQAWYNNKGYHSMPVYLNTLNNAILRANLPKSRGHPAAYGECLLYYNDLEEHVVDTGICFQTF